MLSCIKHFGSTKSTTFVNLANSKIDRKERSVTVEMSEKKILYHLYWKNVFALERLPRLP